MIFPEKMHGFGGDDKDAVVGKLNWDSIKTKGQQVFSFIHYDYFH